MASKPTQRSLKLLRDWGYRVAIVEHWNSFVRQRQDLFGFCDLLAVSPSLQETLMVQTTSGANTAARVTKLLTERADEVRDCLLAGNRIEVHGWALKGARGKRKKWEVRRVQIVVRDGIVIAE